MHGRSVLCKQRRSVSRGFSLVELMAALLIGSVTMTALMTFFSVQTSNLRLENTRRETQTTARMALDFLVRHLSHIGRDPNGGLAGANVEAIETATDASIHYYTNLSDNWADTDAADAWEDMTLTFSGGALSVNDVNGGGSLVLTGNPKVSITDLFFTYFDKDGNVLDTPVATTANRASIRRINVSLTVEGNVSGDDPTPSVTLSQDVFLRNRS